MGASKSDKLFTFIERAVNQALAEEALNNPAAAEWLSKLHGRIAQRTAGLICFDNNRMMEA